MADNKIKIGTPGLTAAAAPSPYTADDIYGMGVLKPDVYRRELERLMTERRIMATNSTNVRIGKVELTEAMLDELLDNARFISHLIEAVPTIREAYVAYKAKQRLLK